MIFHCYFAVSFFDLFIAGTAVDTQNLIGGFDVIVIHGFYGHESDMIDAQPVGNVFEQTDLGRTDGAVCFGNAEQEIEQLYFRSFRHLETDLLTYIVDRDISCTQLFDHLHGLTCGFDAEIPDEKCFDIIEFGTHDPAVGFHHCGCQYGQTESKITTPGLARRNRPPVRWDRNGLDIVEHRPDKQSE